MSFDVAVLGGGPAGLAAAWWTARTGRSVVLYEAAPQVGGLAASFEVAGLRVDHGSHRLHPATAPHIMTELTALLGDDLQRRTRHGRLRLAGKWFDFPPSPSQLLRHAPPSFAAGLARDLATGPLRQPRLDTYEEVVRAGVGPTLGQHLYFPFARKLWGKEPHELDGEQARKRIKAGSPLAIARKALSRSSTKHFFYPRRGFGQITEALAQAATDAGATIHTGTPVTTVDRIDAGTILSTIPMRALVNAMGPTDDIRAAANAQRSRGAALVYLVLDRPQWTEYDAHYLPSLDQLAHRVSEPKNYRDGDDPASTTVLCAEVPCWPDDDVWRTDDAALAARVAADLDALGLSTRPVDHVVRRVRSVYPVYEPGFAPGLAAVEAWLDAQPRVRTLGRQGLFAHDNTHHTLEMAWEAVVALDDPARWASARAAFRDHVVED